MKIFQIGHIYPNQCAQLRSDLLGYECFREAIDQIVQVAPKSHILKPCLDNDPQAFLSFHQEPVSMRLWARENGLKPQASLDDILLAQIEEHAPEVIYNVHASAMSADLIRRLPGCVRLKIAWLGSPLIGDGFQYFDAVVSNFQSINTRHMALGLRANYFVPSYDQTVDMLPVPQTRDIDLLFVGGYSRHHRNRSRLLKILADSAVDYRFALHLDQSRYTSLAETPLGWFPPLSAVRRPKAVRRLAQPPIFGKELFMALLRTKIVVNMAIDMAGEDRGNIRCFETLSAGALLLSDVGNYPNGFRDGDNMVTYHSPEHAVRLIRDLLADPVRCETISVRGNEMVKRLYSKERQWEMFYQLCSDLS